MPCTVLVAAADAAGRPPLLAHSFDTPGGVDFRLVRVPSMKPSAAALRPVFRYEEEQLPRFCGASRGPIAAYEAQPGDLEPEKLGELPQASGPTYGYWEAASGIANEKGVMMAELSLIHI